MRPNRSSAPPMIRSAVAGSAMSPSTVSTSGSSVGFIVRAVATTAQPCRAVRGDQARADALGAAGDDGDLLARRAHDVPRAVAGGRMIAGSLGCGDSGVVVHRHPGGQRQRLQDRLHLGRVAGLPQAERAPVARQRPQPEQVSLAGQVMGGLGLARPRCPATVSAGRARRDGQDEGDQELRGLSACPAAGGGSFGCGESGVTSSVRHTRSGIEARTSSSWSPSAAANSPSVRHSPGSSGGRHRRSRCPGAASSREWAASRVRMSWTACSGVPSGTWVVMVTRYSIVEAPSWHGRGAGGVRG